MKRVFLIGHPVAHSLSPAMHNAAFQTLGLDWQYELLESTSEELPQTVARVRASDCAGANVTIPHKQAIIPYLDKLTDRARRMGAVNTIIRQNGHLLGDNTDGEGFLHMLDNANVNVHGANILILGAGGAARGVAFALAERPVARLTLVNRTRARAETLAHDLQKHFPHLTIGIEPINHADMIVNATKVGMSPCENESPLSGEFPRDTIAVDLVYRPLYTRFLHDAERAGAQTVNGLPMLVFQGAAALTLWTRCAAPVDLMQEVVHAAISNGG